MGLLRKFFDGLGEFIDAILDDAEGVEPSTMRDLNVSEYELRRLGISGEYYHYRSTGNLAEFDRRYGPLLRRDIPIYRGQQA